MIGKTSQNPHGKTIPRPSTGSRVSTVYGRILALGQMIIIRDYQFVVKPRLRGLGGPAVLRTTNCETETFLSDQEPSPDRAVSVSRLCLSHVCGNPILITAIFVVAQLMMYCYACAREGVLNINIIQQQTRQRIVKPSVSPGLITNNQPAAGRSRFTES